MGRARRAGSSARLRARGLKALVTDVDGTLTDAERRLDPAAIQALGALTDRGWPIILATGNVLPIALALHRSLGLNGPIVAENGGMLYEELEGKVRVRRLTDRRMAVRAFQRARAAGLPVRRLFTDRWRESEVAVEPTVSVRALAAAVRALPVRVESTGYAIHLMQREGGKLPALREALAPLGIEPSDCLIAGDGDNDVAMLRAAGIAVSFPTASAAARRAADLVARAPYARGFVEALKRLGVYESPGPPGNHPNARRQLRQMR